MISSGLSTTNIGMASRKRVFRNSGLYRKRASEGTYVLENEDQDEVGRVFSPDMESMLMVIITVPNYQEPLANLG